MKYDYRKFSIEDRKTYKPILEKLPYNQALQDFFAECNRHEQRLRKSDKRHVAFYGEWERIEFALPCEVSAEESYFENIQIMPLHNAINNLPNIQRRRLTAHYFEGFSQREIATREDVSETAVSCSLAKARKNLKMMEINLDV